MFELRNKAVAIKLYLLSSSYYETKPFNQFRPILTLRRLRGTHLGTLTRNFRISANRKDKIGKQKLVAGTLIYQTLAYDFFY